MSNELEAIAEMVAPQPQILPIDEAEEALALVGFYKLRGLSLRAACASEHRNVIKGVCKARQCRDIPVAELDNQIAHSALIARAIRLIPYSVICIDRCVTSPWFGERDAIVVIYGKNNRIKVLHLECVTRLNCRRCPKGINTHKSIIV